MKVIYLRFIKDTVWITVWRVWSILVIRPESMNAKICCRLSSLRVAASVLGVTVCSWPLCQQKINFSKPKEKREKRTCYVEENYVIKWEQHQTNLLNKVKEIKILWETKNWQILHYQKLDQYWPFELHVCNSLFNNSFEIGLWALE